MGREKALIALEDGRALLAHRVAGLRDLADEVLLVGDDAQGIARRAGIALGGRVRAVADARPDGVGADAGADAGAGAGAGAGPAPLGPLAGVCAALREARAERVLVTACDMPFVVPALYARLFEEAARPGVDVALPRARAGARGLEPLAAVYARSAREHLEDRLRAGVRALHEALAGLRLAVIEGDALRAVDPDGRGLVNWNEPGDVPGRGDAA